MPGPSDTLQARTRARPQTFNCNGFILDDFKSENADASTGIPVAGIGIGAAVGTFPGIGVGTDVTTGKTVGGKVAGVGAPELIGTAVGGEVGAGSINDIVGDSVGAPVFVCGMWSNRRENVGEERR